MKRLVESVKALTENELIGANEKFPMFRSTHEGYAILLEKLMKQELKWMQ